MSLKGLVNVVKSFVSNHKLGLLTIGSGVGLLATVGTTALVTKNSIYEIADAQYQHELENGEGAILPVKEKAKIIAKNSVPAVTSVVCTAVCIGAEFKEASKLSKQLKASAITISTLSNALEVDRVYKQKVKERLGEKEEREIRDEMALEEAKDRGKEYILSGCIYDTGHGNTIFMDKAGGFLYKSSFDAVYKAYDRWFGYVNNGSCEFSSFNELYYLLDLHVQTQLGESEGIISSYDKGFSTHQLSINEDLNVKCDDTILGPEHVVNLVYIDDEYVRHMKEVF